MCLPNGTQVPPKACGMRFRKKLPLRPLTDRDLFSHGKVISLGPQGPSRANSRKRQRPQSRHGTSLLVSVRLSPQPGPILSRLPQGQPQQRPRASPRRQPHLPPELHPSTLGRPSRESMLGTMYQRSAATWTVSRSIAEGRVKGRWGVPVPC